MPFEFASLNLWVLMPVIIVMGWGIIIVILDLLAPPEHKHLTPWFAMAGLLLAFIINWTLWDYNGGTFTLMGAFPMLLVDNYAVFLNAIFLLTGILTILISVNFLQRTGLERPEFYMLMLFSISGMMLMGMANDLILTFLALELLSIPLYILAGFAAPRVESEESAMKYFLLGAFSSSIFVFGIALTYGATGSTVLPEVVDTIAAGGLWGYAGAGLLILGFAFKVAAVPFHMWTPDVYEGAPTAVTAFMSVGAKVGGFAAMLRVLVAALPEIHEIWVPTIAVISALTLIVGNVVAIRQSNIKRMLGYSSIAHAGYILIAVAASAASPDGVSASLFYMLAYLFTNLGAFAIVILVERKQGEGVLLDDYRGLARRYPAMALAMTIFMLSLTGVPPTGGFSGKLFVFRSSIEASMNGAYDMTWLLILGVLTSVVSAFYYLRVVYLMYMVEGDGEMVEAKPAISTAVAVTVAFTLLLGLLPGFWFDLARDAILVGVQAVAGG